MKLAHPDLQFIMSISENRFPVLVLERPDVFFRLISQLCAQTEGVAGPFVLSEDWEPLDIGRTVLLITDMFHIDLNGRKQTSALSRHLNSLAVSEHYIQSTLEMKDIINRWALELENDIPLATVHNESVDIGAILKAVGIKFEDNSREVSEQLCGLIKICASFMNVRLLAIVGLHTCLENKAIEAIYQTAMYEKVPILDIERHMPETRLPCEKCYIIDRDNCEIYNDND